MIGKLRGRGGCSKIINYRYDISMVGRFFWRNPRVIDVLKQTIIIVSMLHSLF